MAQHKLADLLTASSFVVVHGQMMTVQPHYAPLLPGHICLGTQNRFSNYEIVDGNQVVDLVEGCALVTLVNTPGRAGQEVAMAFFKSRGVLDEDVVKTA
jgi:hypothetical protein